MADGTPAEPLILESKVPSATLAKAMVPLEVMVPPESPVPAVMLVTEPPPVLKVVQAVPLQNRRLLPL